MKIRNVKSHFKVIISVGCMFGFLFYVPSVYSWKVEQQSIQLQKSLTKPQPPQPNITKKLLLQELYKPTIDYTLFAKLPDPFVPFLKPKTEEALEGAMLEELLPPEPVILTPLQKMDLSEIERGFRGTLWGPYGRKAIIEDSTGKGYIVNIGTRIGKHDGVVVAILKDRLIIRQKIWSRKKRNFVYEEVTVKLHKGS